MYFRYSILSFSEREVSLRRISAKPRILVNGALRSWESIEIKSSFE
jgi:hypothetical protein